MAATKRTQSNKPDFPKLEEDILAFWEKKEIFQQSLEKTRDGKPFVFFEGPPTANGMPGIHHVLARAYKDVIPRYQTMRGRFVERKAGWDTHGLPVELQVEKELKISGKPEIEKYGIAAFNAKCRESVWQYQDAWERLTKRIGYWIDLEHPYITYHNDYIESLWWIIKQVWDKGLLYKGYKVVPHCPRCGTALSSHEVALGYEEVTEESVYVKFRLVNEPDTYMLSWTTTPWTLPGNVALAVGRDITYAKIKVGKEYYIVAQNIADSLFGKYKEVDTCQGVDLVGMSYEPLFSIAALQNATAHKVYTADFVTTEEGTGIVHTAVMYGEDDYQLGEKVGLPKHHTVDENGNFTADVAQWAGQFVKDKDVERGIINYLEEQNLLLRATPYKHSYPFCWRCDTPLLYYAKNSWFVRMSELKDRLIKANQTIKWTPAYIQQGRFGEWLNELKDWAFSRERYWGTPLPIWEADDGDCVCIGSREELRALAKQPDMITDDFDMHRPYIDDVVVLKDGKEYHRVPEVVDVWFDSGAMPFAQWHYPFTNTERIDKGTHYPADYIAEAIDQTRGWFYTLLAVATLLDKEPPYKSVTCLNLILDEHGKKMSKSRGNVVDPFAAIRKYGADPLRWYLYTMNQPGETKLFSEKQLEDVVKKVWLILWNVLTFWQMYRGEDTDSEQASEHILDRWVTARLQALVQDVTIQLEGYQVTEAARALTAFINDLSTWYVRRSRNRFKSGGRQQQAAAATLRRVLSVLAQLMAPFAPMFADIIYRAVKRKKNPASVHLTDWPEPEKLSQDTELIQTMELVRKAVELGHNLRKQEKIKVRQPLSQLIIQGALDQEYRNLVQEELNVQEVIAVDTLPSGSEFVTAYDHDVKVALDTTITDELREQGLAREIVRHINAMRKDAQLTVNDSITMYYESNSDRVIGVIQHYKSDICQEIIAKDCLPGIPENIDARTVIELDGSKASFGIKT